VLDASNASQPASARGGFRAVITDWGGVMTTPISDAVRVWLETEDIDAEHYAAIMRPWVVAAYDPAADGNPIHALERGECTVAEFERLLAARIIRRNGGSVLADGLLGRMFAATTPCDPMYAVVYALRKAGLRTGLLSNSWGIGDYPRHLFPGLFDAVVISGEVGMRKPEPRIFRHVASLLGLDPAECVFIDDIEANVVAAGAVGMTGVLHSDPAVTVARLNELLGVELDGSR
jgi:putative hydrolase of the HAD superfamily